MNFYQIVVIVGVCVNHVSSDCCPPGWVASDTSCYLFARNYQSSFTEAEHYCRQHHNTHLVEVETAAENLFLRDYMRGLKVEHHWLGITDERTEGIWRWFNNDTIASYVDWFPGQPGSDGEQDCAVFWSGVDYQWADVPCTNKYEPICEKSFQLNTLDYNVDREQNEVWVGLTAHTKWVGWTAHISMKKK